MSGVSVIERLIATANLSRLLGAAGFTAPTVTADGLGIDVYLDRNGASPLAVAETLGLEDIEIGDEADGEHGGPHAVVHARWCGWPVTMFGPQAQAPFTGSAL